jgi:UDP-glucose 4-epimerase
VNVAVTGASGYFAPYVIRAIESHGHSVFGIDLLAPQGESQHSFRQADLTNLESAKRALDGAEAVVHLAGIPIPIGNSPDDVYKANALGTFVTAWAAGEQGIERFIYASSESVLGNAFHPDVLMPEYFPIDERHPTFPLDPYGISKLAAEHAIECAAQRFSFAAAALRMPWIWARDADERKQFYQELITNYPLWKKNLWAFVDARDAGEAFALALTSEALKKGKMEPYFIVATQHWVAPTRSTASLIEEFYPNVHRLRDPDTYGSLISNTKAHTELGLTPEYGVEPKEN